MTDTTTQQPGDPGTGGNSDTPPPLTREHRTHTSPERINAFKSLSLFNKLSLNKDIKKANNTRERQRMKHIMDPIKFPVNGSPAGSLLTIEPEELEELRIPSVFEKLKDLVTVSLLFALAKLSKKREGDPLTSQASKRVCALGTKEPAQRSLGLIRDVEFDQILFDTEPHRPIPLNFFLRKNLRFIVDEGSSLPKIKVNPTSRDPSTPVSVRVLDIAKLVERFGHELTMSCAEWSEASELYFKFQQSRDIEGPEGRYSTWLYKHFEFFSRCEERNDYYKAWKALERELRLQYRSTPEPFCGQIYFFCYKAVCETFDANATIDAKLDARLKLLEHT